MHILGDVRLAPLQRQQILETIKYIMEMIGDNDLIKEEFTYNRSCPICGNAGGNIMTKKYGFL